MSSGAIHTFSPSDDGPPPPSRGNSPAELLQNTLKNAGIFASIIDSPTAFQISIPQEALVFPDGGAKGAKTKTKFSETAAGALGLAKPDQTFTTDLQGMQWRVPAKLMAALVQALKAKKALPDKPDISGDDITSAIRDLAEKNAERKPAWEGMALATVTAPTGGGDHYVIDNIVSGASPALLFGNRAGEVAAGTMWLVSVPADAISRNYLDTLKKQAAAAAAPVKPAKDSSEETAPDEPAALNADPVEWKVPRKLMGGLLALLKKELQKIDPDILNEIEMDRINSGDLAPFTDALQEYADIHIERKSRRSGQWRVMQQAQIVKDGKDYKITGVTAAVDTDMVFGKHAGQVTVVPLKEETAAAHTAPVPSSSAEPTEHAVTAPEGYSPANFITVLKHKFTVMNGYESVQFSGDDFIIKSYGNKEIAIKKLQEFGFSNDDIKRMTFTPIPMSTGSDKTEIRIPNTVAMETYTALVAKYPLPQPVKIEPAVKKDDKGPIPVAARAAPREAPKPRALPPQEQVMEKLRLAMGAGARIKFTNGAAGDRGAFLVTGVDEETLRTKLDSLNLKNVAENGGIQPDGTMRLEMDIDTANVMCPRPGIDDKDARRKRLDVWLAESKMQAERGVQTLLQSPNATVAINGGNVTINHVVAEKYPRVKGVSETPNMQVTIPAETAYEALGIAIPGTART